MLSTATHKEGVQRVAPWLTTDANAYPAVVNGRIICLGGYEGGLPVSARHPRGGALSHCSAAFFASSAVWWMVHMRVHAVPTSLGSPGPTGGLGLLP